MKKLKLNDGHVGIVKGIRDFRARYMKFPLCPAESELDGGGMIDGSRTEETDRSV